MLAACTSDGTPQSSRTFDPCVPVTVGAPDASDAQRTSIAAAIEMWHAAGLAAPSDSGAAEPTIVIRFESAAPAIFGLYDDATIHINIELDGAARSITIAHELGHAFGLVHVPIGERASVMNAGNLTIAPAGDDLAPLAAIWGACDAGLHD